MLNVKMLLMLFLVIISLAIVGIPANAQTNATITLSTDSGPVTTEITINGTDFPFNSHIDLYWNTFNGSWVIDGHDFLGSISTPHKYIIASVNSDSSGSFVAQVKVPYDFGGTHLVTAVETGNTTDLAQAAFTIIPSFSISPRRGPPGTLITIQGYGLGRRFYTTNWHVLWDNNYVGYATSITTHGNVSFTIPAVGDIGKHFIDIYEGYPGPAYLNIQQAPENPVYYSPPLIPFHTDFIITSPGEIVSREITGPLAIGSLGLILATLITTSFIYRRKSPQKTRKWVLPSLIAIIAIIVSGTVLISAYNVAEGTQIQPTSIEIRPKIVLPNIPDSSSNDSLPTLSITPPVAVVGQEITITGSNFSTAENLELIWITKQGSYLRGWNDRVSTLGNVSTNTNGSFTFNTKVPYDLEGSHIIGAKSETIMSITNTSLYITRSAEIFPTKGPSGTIVEISMTGVGWTFVTNTATIVYDNSFVGYVCGFNTQGNVTLFVTAVGQPGIHSIDIYPTIYDGPPAGTTNAVYRYPLLTPEDHPTQSPAFHFEFLITESDLESATSMMNVTTENISIITLMISAIVLTQQGITMLRSARAGTYVVVARRQFDPEVENTVPCFFSIS